MMKTTQNYCGNWKTYRRRRAQHDFVCVIACVLPDGETFTVRGACEGVIARELCGDGGFGYDPLFFVPEHGCTFGMLPASVKNQISHRARALKTFAETLKNKIQE